MESISQSLYSRLQSGKTQSAWDLVTDESKKNGSEAHNQPYSHDNKQRLRFWTTYGKEAIHNDPLSGSYRNVCYCGELWHFEMIVGGEAPRLRKNLLGIQRIECVNLS